MLYAAAAAHCASYATACRQVNLPNSYYWLDTNICSPHSSSGLTDKAHIVSETVALSVENCGAQNVWILLATTADSACFVYQTGGGHGASYACERVQTKRSCTQGHVQKERMPRSCSHQSAVKAACTKLKLTAHCNAIDDAHGPQSHAPQMTVDANGPAATNKQHLSAHAGE